MSNTLPKTSSPSKSCVFDVLKIPIERFRKPSDGRKWKAAASARKTLLVQLAGYADADGTNIRPSTQTLAGQTGFSRRKICYLLDDLQELGLVERTGRHGQRGAAIRKIVTAPALLDSGIPPLGVQDSPGTPPLRVQDSISESAKLNPQSAGFASQSAKLNPESATAVAQDLPADLPADLPSKPARADAVRNTDENLWEGLADAFEKAQAGEQLSRVGLEAVKALAAEVGSEVVLTVWQHWLKTRDTRGMKYHLKFFHTEFDRTRRKIQEAETRTAEHVINKQREAESKAIEREWIDGLNQFANGTFLSSCTDQVDWNARFDEWIRKNPVAHVWIDCGDGNSVPVDGGTGYIDGVKKVAEEFFEAERQRGFVY
jgi:hypothetical protein